MDAITSAGSGVPPGHGGLSKTLNFLAPSLDRVLARILDKARKADVPLDYKPRLENMKQGLTSLRDYAHGTELEVIEADYNNDWWDIVVWSVDWFIIAVVSLCSVGIASAEAASATRAIDIAWGLLQAAMRARGQLLHYHGPQHGHHRALRDPDPGSGGPPAMTREPSILDFTPWALSLGALFSRALGPATPAPLHPALAEQACALVEEAAVLATEAPDEAAPWRALFDGEVLHLVLDDGLALAQFEGTSLVSLRVETDDGRRWSVIRTGQGRSPLSLLDAGSPGPELKIALFEEGRLLWSRSCYADGRAEDDRDLQGAADEVRNGMAQGPSTESLLGSVGAAALGAAVLGAGALLARKVMARKAREADLPAPPPASSPAPPPAFPAASPPLLPPPSPGPAWRVVGLSGSVEGRSFSVEGTVILGRDPAADIPVEDRSASRRHAELKAQPRGLLLTDLESSNGTWLGDARVLAPLPLKDGDVFAIGTCRFRVEAPGGGTPTVALPKPAAPPPPPAAEPMPAPVPALPLCPSCRKPLAPGWQFCGHCGASLQPRLCRTCGVPLPEGARFCGACGTPA